MQPSETELKRVLINMDELEIYEITDYKDWQEELRHIFPIRLK